VPPNDRRSAASRVGSLSRFGFASRAARRLQRLVRQPARISDSSGGIENPLERLVDGLLGGKGVGHFWLDEHDVCALARPSCVLATDAALHRCKVVLGTHVVSWDVILLHRTFAHAAWRVAR